MRGEERLEDLGGCDLKFLLGGHIHQRNRVFRSHPVLTGCARSGTYSKTGADAGALILAELDANKR